VRADEKAVEKAARMLIEARRPLIVVGDEVWKSGAQDAVVTLSEMLGIAVGETRWPAYANFPAYHPHFIGGGFAFMGSDFIKGVDLVVSVGARDFGGPSPPTRPGLPDEAAIVRIGMDTDAMGRSNATDLALVSDARDCLEDLKAAVESLATRNKYKVWRALDRKRRAPCLPPAVKETPPRLPGTWDKARCTPMSWGW
jgi:benzoylformate decarboxylase